MSIRGKKLRHQFVMKFNFVPSDVDLSRVSEVTHPYLFFGDFVESIGLLETFLTDQDGTAAVVLCDVNISDKSFGGTYHPHKPFSLVYQGSDNR